MCLLRRSKTSVLKIKLFIHFISLKNHNNLISIWPIIDRRLSCGYNTWQITLITWSVMKVTFLNSNKTRQLFRWSNSMVKGHLNLDVSSVWNINIDTDLCTLKFYRLSIRFIYWHDLQWPLFQLNRKTYKDFNHNINL